MHPSFFRMQTLDLRLFWRQLSLAEISGSLGDLGTFLPLLLALVHADAIQFAPALFWAGAFNILTGLLWNSPMPVQPMKTISAVAIAEGLTSVETIGAGLGVAVVVTFLGLTGGIELVNWIIPLEVVRGLQLGLGLSLLRRGLQLQATVEFPTMLSGIAGFMFTLFALRYKQGRVIPAALVLAVVGIIVAIVQATIDGTQDIASPALPIIWTGSTLSFTECLNGFLKAGLAQIPLTTLNSVVSVCELNSRLFPENQISRTSVASSVGLMNLLGLFFGSMPMCHGAGGLAAQYRFGARTGSSVVFLGAVKVLLACILGFAGTYLFNFFPNSILAVLIAFAGLSLAVAGCKPQEGDTETMYVGLVGTAATSLAFNTGWGCVAGIVVSLFNGRLNHVFERITKACIKPVDKKEQDRSSVSSSEASSTDQVTIA